MTRIWNDTKFEQVIYMRLTSSNYRGQEQLILLRDGLARLPERIQTFKRVTPGFNKLNYYSKEPSVTLARLECPAVTLMQTSQWAAPNPFATRVAPGGYGLGTAFFSTDRAGCGLYFDSDILSCLIGEKIQKALHH
jgi:hypothetical protein